MPSTSAVVDHTSRAQAPLLHSQAVQPIQRLQQARPENQSPLRQEKSEEHANLDDRKSLLDALGKTLNSASTDMPDLDLTRFAVSPDSSLGRELKLINPAHVSLNWFIKHQGWIAPTNKEALQNLYDAITYAPPPQPAHRDYWGMLSREVPLTLEQRQRINEIVEGWLDKTKGGLIENLVGLATTDAHTLDSLSKMTGVQTRIGSTTQTTKTFGPYTQTETCTESPLYAQTYPAWVMGTNRSCSKKITAEPRYALYRLLLEPKAIELGKKLEAELGVLPTVTSAAELVLSALVLSVMPQLPTTRNLIGNDFALDAPDHLRKSPEAIVEALDLYLLRTHQHLKADNVRTVSYLMLSRIAPQFLVKDLPDSLLYGTHQWATFSAAVSRIEHSAPGTSATMNYQQVMNYDATTPITEQDKAFATIALRDALVDWAITNGRLDKRADNNYSESEIQQAHQDFQHQPSSLVRAGQQLATPLPNREQIALNDLKRVFGNQIDFTRKVLQATPDNLESDKNHFYSLLDVHMSGKLQAGMWRSISSDFSMAPIEKELHRLHSIEWLFTQTFNNYYTDLLQGHNAVVRNLLSQLPEEHRSSLQWGEQKFYALRKAVTSHYAHLIPKAEKEASKGRQGFIIRSEHQSKVTYYEVFPQQGKIQIRTDLPAEWPEGINTRAVGNVENNIRQPFDWEAYNSGTPPRENEFSEVVIEHIPTPDKWQRSASDKTPDLSFLGGKSFDLARTAASKHLAYDEETLRQQASGESAVELTERYQKTGAAAVLSLVPFANTLKHAINGEIAEAFTGFIIDGVSTAIPVSQPLRAFAHSIKSSKTLFNMLRKASHSTDDLVGLLGSAGKTAKPFYSTIPSFGGLRPTSNGLVQSLGVSTAVRIGRAEGVDAAGGGARTLAKIIDEKWYPVDAASGKAYGTPIEGFAPEGGIGFFERPASPQRDPDALAQYEANVINAKYSEPTSFPEGFKHLSPDTVPGYKPSMGVQEIEDLIATSNFSTEQIGSLVRQRERLLLAHTQRSAQIFQREVTAAGGTTRGMPQTYYLSQTSPDIAGECAALSTAMGLALLEGNEDTLLDNLVFAMANPEAENSAKFIRNLSSLQSTVGNELGFHSSAVGNPISYKSIIKELSEATSSKTLMISSTNHGMLAGVKVDPTGTTPKSWFFYDPNYGKAIFPTQESMAKGLEKTLSNGITGKNLDAFGTILTGKKYKVSAFDADVVASKFNIDRVRGLTQPI